VRAKLSVGGRVVAKQRTPFCGRGELGVCYRVVYKGGEARYGILFARGGHHLFTPDEAARLLRMSGRVISSLAHYRYETLPQLKKDYAAGRFEVAFR
jgi:hypothetical protein